MITCTARQTVREGREAELARLMEELTRTVRAREPGCVLFQWVKSRTTPRTFLVVEQYTDDDAFARHRATDYLAAFIPKMMACLEREPELEVFEDVAP